MTPLVLAVAAAALTFQIESPQKEVLVGEPVKLIVRWKNTGMSAAKIAPETPEFGQESLGFRVADGMSERIYRESPHVQDSGGGAVSLGPGEEFASNLVLLQGFYVAASGSMVGPDLVFPRPGDYRVRAEYWGNDRGLVDRSKPGLLSGEIRFRVAAPRGADAEILAFSLKNRRVLELLGSSKDEQEKTRVLMERYPRSPYFRWARLRALQFKGELGAGAEDREAMASLRASDDDAYGRQIQLFYGELAREALAFDDWGPFEEDALAQAYFFARSARDADLMRTARELLLGKHPRSGYSRKLEEEDQPSR